MYVFTRRIVKLIAVLYLLQKNDKSWNNLNPTECLFEVHKYFLRQHINYYSKIIITLYKLEGFKQTWSGRNLQVQFSIHIYIITTIQHQYITTV